MEPIATRGNIWQGVLKKDSRTPPTVNETHQYQSQMTKIVLTSEK